MVANSAQEPVAPPELYDIDVQNSTARSFFMSLVEDTSYNMVVHPEVEGTISLTLSDVTIDEVMALTQRVYGYEYEKTRNGFIVLPARLEALGMQAEVCFNEPNGRNINLDCGSLHLEKLRQRVLDDGAEVVQRDVAPQSRKGRRRRLEGQAGVRAGQAACASATCAAAAVAVSKKSSNLATAPLCTVQTWAKAVA